MRKIALVASLLALLSMGTAQPVITQLSFPETVDVYSLFELSFKMQSYDNPYDPDVIRVYADFVGPNHQSYRVEAFYFEGYSFKEENQIEKASRNRAADGWKIRFTPSAVGEWKFTLHAVDKKGSVNMDSFNRYAFSFHCRAVDSASGFITKANTRYLKRTIVKNARQQEQSFFPIGPNVAWYSSADFGKYKKPYGIYDYEKYIDKLSGNANYLRLWINRYQYLSIYGPEHAGTADGKTVMYFDKSLNQKDSAELDYIIQYAAQHGIAVMPCIFNYRNYVHEDKVATGTASNPARPSDWKNNPFHTVLGLDSHYQFFTDMKARRIEQNLLRYVVSRWGYATNIMAWELWNEVANMEEGKVMEQKTQQDIIDWHDDMAAYLRSIDPYQHLISTSIGSIKKAEYLYSAIFSSLDFVQNHNYQSVQKMASKEQFSYVLYNDTETARRLYGNKPFFMGEFAFGQSNPARQLVDKDPYGIDPHNSLWSSSFSGSMGPASFWFWNYLDTRNLYGHFKPLLNFFSDMPILSDSFIPKTTGRVVGQSLVFPNHLETYYMINVSEDTLMGWSQDTAFCYQSLRLLTDVVGKNKHFIDYEVNDPKGYVYTLNPAKRPKPSSKRNTITIPVHNQPVGTRYTVRWFDSETGKELQSEATTVVVRRRWFRSYLSFEFPSSIRDLSANTINNTFGDAVFMICKDQ